MTRARMVKACDNIGKGGSGGRDDDGNDASTTTAFMTQ